MGCGTVKIPNYINIDCDASLEPDLVCNVGIECLPYENETVSEILIFHTLERVEKKYWVNMLMEFNRVLFPGGELILTYPEFTICYEYWKENHKGMRDYWEACLYGRQASPSDYHVSICHTPEIMELLQRMGFECWTRAELEPQYTITVAEKKHPVRTKEDAINRAIYGSNGRAA